MARFLARRRIAAALVILLVGPALLLAHSDRRDARRNALERYMPTEGETGEGDSLERMELDWHNRVTYPTGRFDPQWLRDAAAHHALMSKGIPAGKLQRPKYGPESAGLSPYNFVSLGPKPLRMTGCTGCYNYSLTSGRVNTIVVDPTTTTNGSIVAYAGSDGGGVWKTTNCCASATSANPTTWTSVTDDPLLATITIDTLTIDPNDHNTIYAGTGDLNYGSYSFGSQGILKSTDAGAHWTLLGADVFGPSLFFQAGQFPQYDSVGKVRVDPNNSNNVVAGTKRGLFLSYDGGASWTGPCLTNTYTTQRQDITGLELSNIGGTTRIVAAVGVRGFSSAVQYNLGENGANGLYKATLPASGCPVFTSITTNLNGWTGQNATSGNKFVSAGATPANGNQLGRIDIAVAPSDPNYIYAQVGAIPSHGQLAAWRTTDGGTTWTQVPGSTPGSLRDCGGSAGDYTQNWYDQGIAVDPNDPNRIFVDTFEIWFWKNGNSSWQDTTCGYSGSTQVVHVDQHALAFLPGSSSILLVGNDGGIHATTNANVANGSTRPTWFNMGKGLNTIEFYSGDISANFATSANPMANGGAQDNGSASVMFNGYPTGPVQWQMGMGGDGFYARIDPVGNMFWQGNNGGQLNYCQHNPPAEDCTAPADWLPDSSPWSNGVQNDVQAFMLPYEIFKGTPDNPVTDCPPSGCGHLIVGTNRVWETTSGPNGWALVSLDLTKGTLADRSFINQLAFEPSDQSRGIVGTNDGNVQYGHSPTPAAGMAVWVNITGGNAVLPNRPILDVWFDPTTTTSPIAYAAVGGFNQNTPSTPGHVFRVVCTADCAAFTWTNKTGNLPDVPVDSIIVNPNLPKQVYAGTDFGLYYTDDITAASPTWARLENGVPHTMIWDMQIDRGGTTLSVWTRGRGAYVWPLPKPNTPPTASLSANPTSGTAALPVDFTVGGTDADSDALTYDLDFGDGTTHGSTSGTVAHTYASAGTFTATLTVTDTGPATATKTVTITVNPNALPVASLSADTTSGIAALPVTFTVSATDGNSDPLTYDLDFGDGTAHGTASGSVGHTYASAGTYTPTLTVTDNHSGSDVKTLTVTVSPDTAPTASLSPVSARVETGQPMSFTVGGLDADAGDTVAFDLDFGDGTTHGTTSGTVGHTYATSGPYTATLTVSDTHGGSVTRTASIVADSTPTASLSPPSATIVAGGTVTFAIAGSDPDAGDVLTFDLDFADGSPHATSSGSISHVFANPGSYLVTLTVEDADGASDTKVASVMVKAASSSGPANNTVVGGALGGLTLLPLLGASLLRRRRR